MPEYIKVNTVRAGGGLLEGSNDEITIIPAVLMAEGVTNGALKLFDNFSKDFMWFSGVPIIGPHKKGDPPVTNVSKKAGQIRNVKLNAEKRRVEAEAVLFNSMFDPSDLERIKAGERFGGSIGFYADEEKLKESRVWTDGTPYNSIESNFFGDHFSIVANPACPLNRCGFNVNSVDDNMTDKVEIPKVETLTVNTEQIPPEPKVEVPKVNVPIVEPRNADDPKAVPAVPVIKSDSPLIRINALEAQFAELKINLVTRDEEIKMLKAAEDIRQNDSKVQAEIAAKAGFTAILNQNAKLEVDKLYPEYVKNPALWIVTNAKHLDIKNIEAGKIEAIGQPFVPHVNASEDDELKGLMPTDEEVAKRVR